MDCIYETPIRNHHSNGNIFEQVKFINEVSDAYKIMYISSSDFDKILKQYKDIYNKFSSLAQNKFSTELGFNNPIPKFDEHKYKKDFNRGKNVDLYFLYRLSGADDNDELDRYAMKEFMSFAKNNGHSVAHALQSDGNFITQARNSFKYPDVRLDFCTKDYPSGKHEVAIFVMSNHIYRKK